MKPSELTEAAMQRSGLTSTRTLAKKLGLTNTSIYSWMKDASCPTFEQAWALAELAGLEPLKTAAEVRQHSLDGKKHMPLLRRIAQSAAAITAVGVAVYIAPITPSTIDVHTSNSLYIMRSRRLCRRALATLINLNRKLTPLPT